MHVLTDTWHAVEPALAVIGAVYVAASTALAVWGIRRGCRIQVEVPDPPADVLLREWAADGGPR